MAERRIEVVISAADDYSAVMRKFNTAVGDMDGAVRSAGEETSKFARKLADLTSASEWGVDGLKKFKNILEGIAFGGVVGAVSALTETMISYYHETFATQQQIEKLNSSVMNQAKAWKLLPEPIGAVSEATVRLYNAELKYLQLQEGGKGKGLERHVKALEQVKRTMEDSPEWAGYFGNSLEQVEIDLERARVALERHNAIMSLTPTTAAKVAESLKPVKAALASVAAEADTVSGFFADDSITNMLLGGDTLESRLMGDGGGPTLTLPLSLNYTLVADTASMEAAVDAEAAIRQELAQRALENMKSPYGAEAVTGGAPGIYQEYDSKLRALEEYNAQKLALMSAAGASELELEAAHTELSNQYAAKRRDFQISAAGQTLGAMSNFLQNLYVATGSKNKAMFKAMKAVAIAEAIVNTSKAATTALDAPPGPPVSFAYVAATIAAGAAQIATISRTEPGGATGTISPGGVANPSYSGGSPNAYPVPTRNEEPRGTQNITVNLTALDPSTVDMDRIVEDNIAPALERLSGENGRNVVLDIQIKGR